MGGADRLKGVDYWGVPVSVSANLAWPLLLLTCLSAEVNRFPLPFYRSKGNPGSNHNPTKIIAKYIFSL